MKKIQPIIHQNIAQLKQSFAEAADLRSSGLISVMIDGSLLRGDFLDLSSDIDITVTTTATPDSILKDQIQTLINTAQARLPERPYPLRPLIYDIQWQDLDTVKEAGQRSIHQWNQDNIPDGYPKLWIYAFDSIRCHDVIWGEDITSYYTRIPPRMFVALRMKRLRDSALACAGSISDYEAQNGAVTQIKNAWETIRCFHLLHGGTSIHKNDVSAFADTFFKTPDETAVVHALKKYYLDNDSSELLTGDFRLRLSRFTLDTIQHYFKEEDL